MITFVIARALARGNLINYHIIANKTDTLPVYKFMLSQLTKLRLFVMKELPNIDIIDAICTDLHQSIDDLFDVIKKQRKDIDKLTAALVSKKIIQ